MQRGKGNWTIYEIDRTLALKEFTPGPDLQSILAALEKEEHIAKREQGGHVIRIPKSSCAFHELFRAERAGKRYGFCDVEQQRVWFPVLRSKAESVSFTA